MPYLFFTFHDPLGFQTEHLQKMLPILKENFQGAFVSVTPETVKQNQAVDVAIDAEEHSFVGSKVKRYERKGGGNGRRIEIIIDV